MSIQKIKVNNTKPEIVCRLIDTTWRAFWVDKPDQWELGKTMGEAIASLMLAPVTKDYVKVQRIITL